MITSSLHRCIEDIHLLLPLWREEADRQRIEVLTEFVERTARKTDCYFLVEGLREAVLETLVPDGPVFTPPEKWELPFRLPFPVTIVETDTVQKPDDGSSEGVFTKQIFVWIEKPEIDTITQISFVRPTVHVAEPFRGRWMLEHFRYDFQLDPETRFIRMYPTTWLKAMRDHLSRGVLPKEVLAEEIRNDANLSVASLRYFLEVLSCVNISTRINHPAPALQKKRERAGSLRLFKFKTLHLLDDSEPQEGTPSDFCGHGSPRLHFRRGHIRRLDPTRRVWVRATMVGKPSDGILRKDYAL